MSDGQGHPKRQPTVAIDWDTYAMAKGRAGIKGMDLKSFVDVALRYYIAQDEQLEREAPNISDITSHDNVLSMFDSKLGKTVDVYRKGADIQCEVDGNDKCIHCLIAFSLPEVAKLGLRRSRA